jgi:2-alkyl-3-oxoalkanoate reductase
MQVMVVGASGAIGSRLVRQLIGGGHEVIGTFNSPGKAERVRMLGAQPIALDLLDASAVHKAVTGAQPDAIIHEATALAGAGFSRSLDRGFAPTNRLRTEGTDNLLAAAREAGVPRLVAQSFAPYRYIREGGPVKTEDDLLDPDPPKTARQTFAAMAHVDQAFWAAGGIVLRYGGFYGAADAMTKAVSKRQYPVLGAGTGIMPFVHLDDAATATVLALEHTGPAIYNITDDEPAEMNEWLPELARALGAKRPFRLPAAVARLIMGGEMVKMSLECRGASNAKARKELGWTLRYPSWRQGFAASYAKANAAGFRLVAAGTVDEVQQGLPLQVSPEIFGEQPLDGFAAARITQARDVRREHDLRQLRQLTARRTAGQLAGVDVEDRAGDAARLERCDERVLVDDFSARDVDQHGVRLHRAEHLGADHLLRRRGQLGADGDEIAGRRQLGQLAGGQQQVDAFGVALRRCHRTPGRDHPHARCAREARDLRTDPAEADDADGRAGQGAQRVGVAGELTSGLLPRRLIQAAREIVGAGDDVLGDPRCRYGAAA